MRSMLFVVVLALSPGLSWSAAPPAASTETAADVPGEVVLAAVSAQRSGDFEAWMRAWHPRTWQGKEEETRKMLDRLREFSPTSERVLDVKIDGDKAVVTLEVSFDGNTSTAPVDLERYEGRWRVTRM
jgi:hypothetical protein